MIDRRRSRVVQADRANPLLALCLISSRSPIEQAYEIARSDIPAALSFFEKHRVIGLAGTKLLQRLDHDDSSSALVRDAVENRINKSRVLDGYWDVVRSTAAKLGILVVGIKGYSARELYDSYVLRDVGDIDIQVDTVDDAWNLANALKGVGFDWCEYELPWVKRRTATGQLYGQLLVWKFHEVGWIRIDIHFGRYSVGHCESIAVNTSDAEISVIRPDDNLPLSVANSAGDHLIRCKDINDIYLLLESPANLDKVIATMRDAGLGMFWNGILELTEEIAQLSVHGSERANKYRIAQVGTIRGRFGDPDWAQRCRKTVEHAYYVGHNRSGHLLGARYSISAYRYYRKPLKLKVSPRCSHATQAKRAIEYASDDRCIRLVPTSLIRSKSAVESLMAPLVTKGMLAGSEQMQVESDEKGHLYVRVHDEIFAPTLDYNVCVTQGSHC